MENFSAPFKGNGLLSVSAICCHRGDWADMARFSFLFEISEIQTFVQNFPNSER